MLTNNGKTKKLQSKRKEESSERMLNEIQASKLSYIEFKAMITRNLNELTENYQKLPRTYDEPTTMISTL